MTRYKIMAFKLVMILLCFGCAQEKPEKVADEFLDHVEKGELEKAGKLGTKKTEQLLTMMASTGLKDSLEQEGYIEFQDLSCNEKNDTVVCSYVAIRRGTEGPEKETVELVKEEGKWRVHIEKQQMEKDR